MIKDIIFQISLPFENIWYLYKLSSLFSVLNFNYCSEMKMSDKNIFWICSLSLNEYIWYRFIRLCSMSFSFQLWEAGNLLHNLQISFTFCFECVTLQLKGFSRKYFAILPCLSHYIIQKFTYYVINIFEFHYPVVVRGKTRFTSLMFQ